MILLSSIVEAGNVLYHHTETLHVSITSVKLFYVHVFQCGCYWSSIARPFTISLYLDVLVLRASCRGLPVDVRDLRQQTPLHLAARVGYEAYDFEHKLQQVKQVDKQFLERQLNPTKANSLPQSATEIV